MKEGRVGLENAFLTTIACRSQTEGFCKACNTEPDDVEQDEDTPKLEMD